MKEDVALDHRHAHEERPQPGEQIAQMLADSDAGVPMKRLEDDGDLAGRLAGGRVQGR